jgi:periplasmic protein TonB
LKVQPRSVNAATSPVEEPNLAEVAVSPVAANPAPGPVADYALIDETGRVTDMKVISGSAMLVQAALDALRTWKHEPARLNREPIGMHTQVSLDFNLH